eukprot:TRINITY_DN40163_c0_g1_i1.p1 TRINITY_DN40163_c0_g1~~TRINITY_DN40163_c0_g1_i1.p1  ORF type:complete len:298 (-),score=33.67 TRINITY_DN40163_c0_g1_i1:98-991(-)
MSVLHLQLELLKILSSVRIIEPKVSKSNKILKSGSAKLFDNNRDSKQRMAKLRLYVDRMSQPSRAVLIFCLINKIDFEEKLINLAKLENKTPEFKAINPLCYVPTIDDGGFKLYESHTILRYLACAYPRIADHWYPADLSSRARIDSILDWHHSNLRRGSADLIFNRVLAPTFGKQSDLTAASKAEQLLKESLLKLENVWLPTKGSFLTGSYQPSIADLSLTCELMQLQLLPEEYVKRLLGPYERVRKWLEKVKDVTSPHFEDVHGIIFKVSQKLQERRAPVSESDNVGTLPRHSKL